ncbi:hypothetical protein VTI74DRAFT_1020 [Chaetomium olivicolor]
MLPQRYVRWLSTQAPSILSAEAARTQRNGVKYLPTNLDPKSTLLFIDKIIGQSLSKNLDLIQPDMHDEIRHSVSEEMDKTANRVLFGLPLCRNTVYLGILRVFIILMGASTLLVGQLPPWGLRFIVGVLLSIPIWVFKKLCLAYVRPLVHERLQAMDKHGGSQGLQKEGAHDFVTQSIKSVKKFKNEIHGEASSYLAEQFLILAFVSMATTGAAATNIFLDILAADPNINLYETLRLEAESVFITEADWTSPASMKKLVNMDSAIRESLRINTLQSRGLLKEVIAKDGILLPDGTPVPQGIWLGVPLQAMQLDEHLYANAHTYDPLRFARLQATASSDESSGIGKGLLDAAQPSEQYLSFSYGRSACPGRWFAVRLLKLIIAYIVLHYDIKPLGHRPANISFGDASIPSFSTKIVVRRRWSNKEKENLWRGSGKHGTHS